MKIILAGATGFIGKELVRQLNARKHTITVLTRNAKNSFYTNISPLLSVEEWDAKNLGAWTSKVDGADAIINLAGEPIAGKRWTKKQKERIVNSRIDTTSALISSIREAKKKPSVLINASAVGFYGNVEQGDVTETSVMGKGFLADTCNQWENEAKKVEQFGVRVALLRTGIVLGKNEGALKKMLPPFQFFVGGPLGSGKQWFPWIHVEDEIQIILFVLENKNISGAINLSSPTPVTNKEFSSLLAKVIHRPSLFPVPSFVLRMMLGEMSEMLLGGQKTIPQKLLQNGYKFLYPNLEDALKEILKK